MKRLIRLLVLTVVLVMGARTLSAQTVNVLMSQKIPVLPATVTSYLEDPLRYFNVQFTADNVGSGGIDIFIDMEMTLNTQPLYVRTKSNVSPIMPVHLSEGTQLVKSDVLWTQVNGRVETNFNYNNLLDAQQLPEGTYQLCLTVYRWENRFMREEPLCHYCFEFVICYSGSAPELVSPMAGSQLALNGAMVVAPNRKINFFWTPVISNCAGTTSRFKYQLKVVKVLDGQNYQDAIRYNPTVFSAEVRNINYAVFDTLRDVKVQMERGALYVAQVQAEEIFANGSVEHFVIANEGNSQPMPFFWDIPEGTPVENLTPIERPSRTYGYTVEDKSKEGEESEGVEGLTVWDGGEEEVSELETIADEMKEQSFAGFSQDAATVESLIAAYPEERKYVPTPKRLYVASDGYYTVPMTDDLEVSFMPSRHDALKNASYAIEIYDYVPGGVDSITAYEPLLREEIKTLPEAYNKMDSHELVNRTLSGWGSKLDQGYLYYLQLTGSYTVGYWNYLIADTSFYVNEMLAEHVRDTVSRKFAENEVEYSNGVYFQWGDDPEAPAFTTPQWKAPVNRSDDDIYDPANHALPVTVPEIQKGKSFPVSWTPVKDVKEGDEVEYEVNVYEVKPGQTLEEAVSSNKVLVSRAVDVNEIAETDKDFFKVFSPKKTYVMTLSTTVNSDTNDYHFENGNESLPLIIKIVK